VDDAGRTWTTAGDAEITNRKVRFIGELTANEPAFPGHSVTDTAQVRWLAQGILHRLRSGQPPAESCLTRHITGPELQTNVVAHWPCEDGSDSQRLASTTPGVQAMKISGDFSLAADSSLASSKPLVTVASGQRANWSARIPRIPQVPGVSWQVVRFVKVVQGAATGSATTLLGVYTNGRVGLWRITINEDQIGIGGTDADGSSVVLTTITSDPSWFDTWAIVELSVTDDGADVDWAVKFVPIPDGSVFSNSGTFTGNTGIPHRFGNSMVGPPEGISTGHLIVTTDESIENGWLAPADTGFQGEPAGARIYRLCREHGIPVTVDGFYGGTSKANWGPAIAAGSQRMGPQRPLQLHELLSECERADNGILSDSRELLGIAYRSGGSLRNQSPQITVGSEVVEPFQPTDDDQRLVNDATVTRTDGSSARYRDEDSIALENDTEYPDGRTINVRWDSQLPDQASWWVHEATWPEMRIPTLVMEMAKSGAPLDDWEDAALGDLVRAEDVHADLPADTLDQLLEGYVERLSPHRRTITANTRPGGPWDTAVRDDGDVSRYDTAGSVLDATYVAGTDTSMDVETTLGPTWTTAAGHVPFDIDVAGARVTVTAIGAATAGVQTFTVDAATVNGVNKSIPAGTAVKLWRTAYRSL
jgi:hypothetical protein